MLENVNNMLTYFFKIFLTVFYNGVYINLIFKFKVFKTRSTYTKQLCSKMFFNE